METEVLMKRELFGMPILQKSKNEYFSATDLVKAGNKWRILNGKDQFNLKSWLQTKQTKEFVASLEEKYGKIKINATGKNRHTWVHPYLFIDLALAINPNLKIEVYDWLFDKLIEYRNTSGDSYKKMAGALWENHTNKSTFSCYMKDVANKIKQSCNVDNWQIASEEQLKLRDKIHENISLLCDVLRDNDEAVKIGILKTVKLIS